MTDTDVQWGPTGQAVYERTYARIKHDGERETWPETVERVARGNLALIHGPNVEEWPRSATEEFEALTKAMRAFRVLPAGRHLWASGVKGRQFLFNCHVAGWDSLTEHVDFVLMRLAEGGGVGANYSTRHIQHIGAPASPVVAHIVCDPSHPDYDEMRDAGVLSNVYDSSWPGAFEVEDTREGWSAAVCELIESAYRSDLKHAARVFDVSRIRWKGARLKSMGGSASGPEPLARALNRIAAILSSAQARVADKHSRVWRDGKGKAHGDDSVIDYTAHSLTPLEAMSIDHAIAETIVAGGNRRSARMSIVHWNDPHVFDFIDCKADTGEHWSTNISVEIDDDFLAALDEEPLYAVDDAGFWLESEQRKRRAHDVLKAIVNGMLTNGEPGIWNSSLSNVGEPNPVVATNPCGEIALEAWENCNLGHVNLDAFVGPYGMVDYPALEDAHRLMTRFLMRATYGDVVDDKQAATLARNRRIGVGHFGVQGFLVKQGIPYTDAEVDGDMIDTLEMLASVVDIEAAEYAHQLRIPKPVKTRTVAPTGTIAKMPGRTEGIHPIYARYFVRRVRFSNSDPDQRLAVNKYRSEGYHVEPCQYARNTSVVEFITKENLVEEVEAMGFDPAIVEQADEISLSDMLSFQAMYQEHWADNAVSYTVNVPAEPRQAEMLRQGYSHVPEPSAQRVAEVVETLTEFLPELKGTTLMLDGSRPQAPYERLTQHAYEHAIAAGLNVTTDASYDEECASGACPVK